MPLFEGHLFVLLEGTDLISEMAQRIFKDLYSFSDETIDGTFMRVAKECGNTEEQVKIAFDLQKNNVWRPNSPVYFSSGTEHKVFSACWVVDLEDSMNSIYDIANVARKVFQNGAGIGIPIGNLRGKDAFIFEGKKTDEIVPCGRSSGPISFMHLYDAVGATTKSGGRARRAAIMMTMPISHPDIIDFIECKEIDGNLSNMNISVMLTDKFMKSFKDNIPFDLITPDGIKVKEINARVLWDKIVDMAWRTADPGILFIDTVNKYNPLKKLMKISCTNPCGEQPLTPFMACNLSSINLHAFCTKDGYNLDGLYQTAYNVMLLMNNLIDKMEFPDERFKENVLKYRPVGVGFMGLSDTLYDIGLPYDSAEARIFASECMKTISTACIEASADLAKESGAFAGWDIVKEDMIEILKEFTGNNERVMAKVQKYGVRNSQHTTVAPTGSTALSCDCSYGIEPCFGLVFTKTLSESGDKYIVVNPIFKNKYENETWYTKDILEKIEQNNGSLKGIRGIPKEVRDVFVVAHDIKAKDRIDMQAGCQKHCSTAISSTCNLPNATTRDEISELYRYAYQKGLKGVTIYRDGSKKSQPITFTKETQKVQSNFNRPSKLQANVHTIDTGNGKMYATVSSHLGQPKEVFISLGKSGQLFNTFCEALGRTISIALQHGVPVSAVIKTLIGINSDRPTWFRFEETDKKPSQLLSIPDAIAQLLQRYYSEAPPEVVERVGNELCTKCGTYSMMKIEGCSTCQSCGESKCG